MDQAKGEKQIVPHTKNEEKDLIWQINNASILADKNGNYAMSSCQMPQGVH